MKGGLAALVVTGALIALPAIASAGPTDPGGVCTVPKRLGIVFVIDDSGSMVDNDANALRGAATDIGIAQLPDGAVAAVSRFSDEAESIFGPAELNAGSRDASRRAVGSALESLGGTDYDQAFAQAKRQLDAMQGLDRRAVVFLSDGEPNEAYTADQPIAAAGIPIFTLGFAEAPPAELGGIAQRSGGQSFFVQSADQAQAAFARIASILNCDVQNTSQDVSLKPGQSKSYSFDVQDGDRAFKALASWAGGGVSVSLTRPDGSVLAPGAERPGESFDAQPTYASVTGLDPPAGPWKLTVSASDQNVSRVQVNIDTFQRLPPGTPASEDPTGPPQTTGEAGCQARITAGPIEAIASCFRKEGHKYVADGRVRLNGIDLTPASGNIVLDLDKLEVRASGSVEAKVGPLTIYEGHLDKSLRAEFALAVPGGATLKGFPVKGDAKVNFEDGHAQLTLNAGLPALLGGITGSATVRATNDNGLDVRNLKLDIPEFKVRVVPIKNVSLAYSQTPDGDRWEGGATVALPGPRPVEISGSAAFLNGGFAQASGSVSGINAPFGGFVFLDKVSGSLTLQPDFAFSGGIGLTAGPRIPVLDAAAAALDGTFSFSEGPPDTYALGGNLKLAEVSLASANAAYRTDGLFTFNGKLDFSKAGFGIESDLSGFVSAGGFNAEGSGKIKTPGPDVDGQGLISDKGVAGCGTVSAWLVKVSAGFGYHWGDVAPEPFSGCDLGPYRSEASASGHAAQALGPGGSTTVRLPSGLRAAAFAVAGAGAPPSVTLTEPGGGRTIGTPADTYVQGPDAVTLRYGPRATTYLLVRQPNGGEWTVSVDGGSSTVTGISTANALPDPDVSARVTGGGASRVMRFRARRIPGQRIVFTEVANGIDRPIAATARSSGRIRFTPSEGAAGSRLVTAEVAQDGMPRTSIAVARFRTSGVVRPGPVGRVRARRKGSRAVFTWGRAKRAASYDVSVSVTDGRRLRLTRTSRRVVVGRLFRTDRVKVVVRARTRAGRLGAGRGARVGRR